MRAEAAAPAMARPRLMGSTAPAGVRSGSSTNARAARSAPRRSLIARPAQPPGRRFRPSAPLPPPPSRVRREAGPALKGGRHVWAGTGGASAEGLRGRRHVWSGSRRCRERKGSSCSGVIRQYILWPCRWVLE